MNFIIRSNGLIHKLAHFAPRWLVPGLYRVRVGQDCSSFSRIHFFIDKEFK